MYQTKTEAVLEFLEYNCSLSFSVLWRPIQFTSLMLNPFGLNRRTLGLSLKWLLPEWRMAQERTECAQIMSLFVFRVYIFLYECALI